MRVRLRFRLWRCCLETHLKIICLQDREPKNSCLHYSCAFNRSSHVSLVYSACACDPLGKDLSAVCYVLPQFFNIFIIYSLSFIGAELADFSSSHASASSVVHYDYNLLSFRTVCHHRRSYWILPGYRLTSFLQELHMRQMPSSAGSRRSRSEERR